MSLQLGYEPIRRSQELHIRRFYHSLRAAIYDYRLENDYNVNIRYYFDTDVVWRLIAASETVRKDAPVKRSQLVRALLSSGRLVKNMHVLPPHALEVYQKIQASGDMTSSSVTDHEELVREALERRGVVDFLEAVHGDTKQDATTLRARLEKNGLEMFVTLEECRGPWQQRLKALWHDLLRIDDDQDDSLRQTRSAAYKSIMEFLRERRPGDDRTSSNVQDGAALATFTEAIANRSRIKHEVRFYTETPALQRLLGGARANEGVRDLLSYREADCPFPTPNMYSDAERFIFRDEGYFLLRAAFPAIGFKSGERGRARHSLKLRELEDVLEHIEGYLKNKPDVGARYLRERVGGRSVEELVDDFGILALTGEIWSNYTVPGEVEPFLPGSDAPTSEAARDAIRELEKNIKEIRKQLQSRLERYQSWMRIYTLLLAFEDSPLRGNIGTPDPLRDLGLVRWGCGPGKQANTLRVQLTELLRGNTSKEAFEDTCTTITAFITRAKTPEELIVAAAILWFIQAHDQAAALLKPKFEINDTVKRTSIRVMHQASLMLGRGRMSPHESKRKVVEELYAEVDGLPAGREKARLYLGLGFVAYHALSSTVNVIDYHTVIADQDADIASHHRPATTRLSAETIETAKWLAQQCLQYGELATLELQALGDTLGLEMAFAVNFSLYMRAVCLPDTAHVSSDFEELLKFKKDRNIWNYRMDDTVGFAHYMAARSRMTRVEKIMSRDVVPSERDLDAIEESIDSAHEAFSAAESAYGDLEIEEHRGLLKTLRSKFRMIRDKFPKNEE